MKTLFVAINSKFIHSNLAVWYLHYNCLQHNDYSKQGSCLQHNDYSKQGSCSQHNGYSKQSSCSQRNDYSKQDSYSQHPCYTQNMTAVREFTINDNKDNILKEIYQEKPDVLAFSCYIWNIEMVLSLIVEIKKLLPRCKVIVGGPEVSYDSRKVLERNAGIDFVVCGEGEFAVAELIKLLTCNSGDATQEGYAMEEGHAIEQSYVIEERHAIEERHTIEERHALGEGYTIEEGHTIEEGQADIYKGIKGLAYRNGNEISVNEGFNLIQDLDSLVAPYTDEMLSTLDNRIVYFESSRGCPFSCSYCISSTFCGVRYFSLERVFSDLATILKSKPKLIKFVDRTFNCNKSRALSIIKHIIDLKCDTTFHFEVAADLFDTDLLQLLKTAPKGRIQLEIGIQTVNEATLNEIDRVTKLPVLFDNVKQLLAAGNIHVHVDLIAGLPYEDYNSFIDSFNNVYNLGAHQLQLGFLKLLKGSKIRTEEKKHGYIYREYSPYEILKNNYITYDEILELKMVEETLERYFNSGRFSIILEYIVSKHFDTPYNFYYELSKYLDEHGYLQRPVSYRENIKALYHFVTDLAENEDEKTYIIELMAIDFLSVDSSGTIPEFIKNSLLSVDNNLIHSMLRDVNFVETYLPDYSGMQARDILKKVFFLKVCKVQDDKLIVFDYKSRDEITGKYRSFMVP